MDVVWVVVVLGLLLGCLVGVVVFCCWFCSLFNLVSSCFASAGFCSFAFGFAILWWLAGQGLG